MSTIFTKIINEEIPGYKIYEDEDVCAFLDINPIQRGHTLVVPKIEVDDLFDLPEDVYLNLMSACKDISQLLKKKLNSARIGVIVDGYLVPHAHIHLVPTTGPYQIDERNQTPATEEELKEVQALLTSTK
ncbi:MAG: hypothetical protein JWN37_761 [Candidatus Nomurabacteria bacterium]|nr:hypothetical protein [Candidatus Nomurabacteria bacterium]